MGRRLTFMRKNVFLKALAQSFLAGDLAVDPVIARVSHTLGKRWSWLPPVVRRCVGVFAGRTRPGERDVIRFLDHDRGFRHAWYREKKKLRITHWLNDPQKMQPVAAATSWKLPKIESSGSLAEWLGVSASELEWFADRKSLGYKQESSRLRHYHYTILTKQAGAIRLIEAPKVKLKALQRKILTGILERVPARAAVNGFVKNRSIKTFVAPHAGRHVILRMDLKDFFPSFPAARVQAIFRTLGYPDAVADFLAGLCTTATPRDVWSRAAFGEDPFHFWESRSQERAFYSRRHLPQGAPTSPALANICAYRLDCRLQGLATSANATYTRYADDLAFSGDEEFGRGVERFALHVAAIAAEEGFRVHHRKTRIMRQGVRQHLAGVVINSHANVMRPDFDRLKAILTNCVRHGPDTQNRESHPRFREHLEGRVGFIEMINAQKGKRLRQILHRIAWQ